MHQASPHAEGRQTEGLHRQKVPHSLKIGDSKFKYRGHDRYKQPHAFQCCPEILPHPPDEPATLIGGNWTVELLPQAWAPLPVMRDGTKQHSRKTKELNSCFQTIWFSVALFLVAVRSIEWLLSTRPRYPSWLLNTQGRMRNGKDQTKHHAWNRVDSQQVTSWIEDKFNTLHDLMMKDMYEEKSCCEKPGTYSSLRHKNSQ